MAITFFQTYACKYNIHIYIMFIPLCLRGKQRWEDNMYFPCSLTGDDFTVRQAM